MIVRRRNYDLSARNTFRMKVRCALYIELKEEADLPALDWDALPQPVMVLGGGSNLLFTRDFPGTVLHFAGGGTDTMPAGEVGAIFGRGRILSCLPRPENVPSMGLEANNDGRGDSHEIPPRPLNLSPASLSASGDFLATVPAGVVFDDFCAWAASEGLWGPENLSLIPGEVGASAVQNIGAYGVEAKDILAGIRAWDRVERRFVDIDPASCAYGYRSSRFKTEWKNRYVITAVTYRLSRAPQPKLDYGGIRKALACHSERSEESLTPQVIRDTIIEIRRKKLPDPAELGSAGSFFCNPVISREHFAQIVKTAREDNGPDYQVPHYEVGDQIKVPAAWMIEQCGFKGRRHGGAQVYPGQPLVIVNASGSATPEEIIGLENCIIQAITDKYGITLHPEVEHI